MARRLQATYRKITALAAQLKQIQERELLRLKSGASRKPIHEAGALFFSHRSLGLCYWWMEEYDQAHTHWRMGLNAGLQYVALTLETIPDFHPEYLVDTLLHSGIMANFLENEEQAIHLLEQTQRFAAGLAPGVDRPQYPVNTLGVYAQYSIARAYALVRLRRLDGFMATTFLRHGQTPRPKSRTGGQRTSSACCIPARSS